MSLGILPTTTVAGGGIFYRQYAYLIPYDLSCIGGRRCSDGDAFTDTCSEGKCNYIQQKTLHVVTFILPIRAGSTYLSKADNCNMGGSGGGSGGGGGGGLVVCTSETEPMEISFDGGETWTEFEVTVTTCDYRMS